MKLSVIIPCYNAADTIGAQLEALSHQQWEYTWEIVVSDNGSTDDSMQIVEQYIRKIGNLRVIDAGQKKGAAYARNKGVEQCSGDFIAFCDADDVVDEAWLPSIGDALFEHNFVACKNNWSKLNDFSEDALQIKVQTEGLIDFSLGKFLQHGGGGTLGIKKSIHQEVNGFDESLPCLEDLEYCWRIQLKGYKLTFLPEAVINIRAKSDHFKIFMQELTWAEYDIYMYKKYRSLAGMPNFSIYKTFKSLYHVLRATRWLFSDEKRSIWVIRLALQLGRLKGSLRYKLFEYGVLDAGLGEIMNKG